MGREEEMEELSLELSIGGKYGKAENLKEKATEFCGENEKSDFVGARCDFSGFETTDQQRRREIQALRSQEARRKREEKAKKSRGLNVVGFVDDKFFLEAQKFQTRVCDREIREKDCFFEGKSRKNGTICSGEVADELGLSLFSEKECLYPKVPSEADCDSEYSNGVKSLEQCSSAVSHKEGSSSDTGSHSSPLRPHQHHGAGADQIESNDSSSQAETDRCLAPIIYPQPSWMRSTEMSNAESSPDGTIVSKETNRDLNKNPPKQSNCSFNAASLPHMPCVSTTGNGPNGKIVTGFLYRYNKTEVSIMCVCHGSSFSPAEFVEHAGGVDVSHPLRHITVVPSVTS